MIRDRVGELLHPVRARTPPRLARTYTSQGIAGLPLERTAARGERLGQLDASDRLRNMLEVVGPEANELPRW
ncbi:MAG: hypothetical protein WD296_16965 [Acidimicrobiia bacterium]